MSPYTTLLIFFASVSTGTEAGVSQYDWLIASHSTVTQVRTGHSFTTRVVFEASEHGGGEIAAIALNRSSLDEFYVANSKLKLIQRVNFRTDFAAVPVIRSVSTIWSGLEALALSLDEFSGSLFGLSGRGVFRLHAPAHHLEFLPEIPVGFSPRNIVTDVTNRLIYWSDYNVIKKQGEVEKARLPFLTCKTYIGKDEVIGSTGGMYVTNDTLFFVDQASDTVLKYSPSQGLHSVAFPNHLDFRLENVSALYMHTASRMLIGRYSEETLDTCSQNCSSLPYPKSGPIVGIEFFRPLNLSGILVERYELESEYAFETSVVFTASATTRHRMVYQVQIRDGDTALDTFDVEIGVRVKRTGLRDSMKYRAVLLAKEEECSDAQFREVASEAFCTLPAKPFELEYSAPHLFWKHKLHIEEWTVSVGDTDRNTTTVNAQPIQTNATHHNFIFRLNVGQLSANETVSIRAHSSGCGSPLYSSLLVVPVSDIVAASNASESRFIRPPDSTEAPDRYTQQGVMEEYSNMPLLLGVIICLTMSIIGVTCLVYLWHMLTHRGPPGAPRSQSFRLDQTSSSKCRLLPAAATSHDDDDIYEEVDMCSPVRNPLYQGLDVRGSNLSNPVYEDPLHNDRYFTSRPDSGIYEETL